MTLEEFKKWAEELKAQEQKSCPACGYCPHCGRGGHYTYPWYPGYPYQPYWWQTTTGQIVGRTCDTITVSYDNGAV